MQPSLTRTYGRDKTTCISSGFIVIVNIYSLQQLLPLLLLDFRHPLIHFQLIDDPKWKSWDLRVQFLTILTVTREGGALAREVQQISDKKCQGREGDGQNWFSSSVLPKACCARYEIFVSASSWFFFSDSISSTPSFVILWQIFPLAYISLNFTRFIFSLSRFSRPVWSTSSSYHR